MSNYESFLIADFQTAKHIGKEPWLAPIDAFPTLINAHLNKGVLEKRLGSSLFAQMNHGGIAQTLPIMGIFNHYHNGIPTLLICDTKRVNSYSAVTLAMTDIAGSDIFNGSDEEFFWFCNWLNVTYMTNNRDQIYKYDDNGLVPFNAQINATGDPNQINTCRMIFKLKNRLLLIDTVEFGQWCPRRCRWSSVINPIFTEDGFIDADTDDVPVTAVKIGDIIIVFMQRSVWRIRWSGDSDNPFKWEHITDDDGSRTPFVGIQFKEGAITVGNKQLIFYDNFQLKDIDLIRMRDFPSLINKNRIRASYGLFAPELRHVYLSYAEGAAANQDKILGFSIDDNGWFNYEYTAAPSCFGYFNNQKRPTFVQLDDVTVGDGALVSAIATDSRAILGNPELFTLMGARNGKIYKLHQGSDDEGSEIAFTVEGSQWNPYAKEGRKVRLGKIQFFVDTDSNAFCTWSLFKDHSTTTYKTGTLSCAGSGTRCWQTIYANGEVGQFHKLKLNHTERANRIRIHAVMPYFKPDGYLDL